MKWIERLRQAGPRRLWFLPPVILGLIVLVISIVLAPGASRLEATQAAVPVRVMTVTPQTIAPRLVAYGEVQPDKIWRAVAQVPGRIVYRHPALKSGAVLTGGTRVLEIDPGDYELSLKRARAQQRSAEAGLEELKARAQDLETSIAIERQTLALTERDFERKRKLARDGHVSALELDAEKQRLLRQRQNVQNLEAQINLLPTQRTALEARIADARAQVARAIEDIDRTRITMPFDGRITAVNIEENQYAPAGQTLLVAETTENMEVLLEVPLESLVSRFPGVMREHKPADNRLTASITYVSRDLSLQWSGRVTRIDPGLNKQTRAARVYVEIDANGSEIPARANLYARVELTGPELDGRIVIPRFAWHDGVVYLVDADNTLVKRPVTVAFRDSDRMAIASGLQPGDRLILTDIPYPVDGMPILPVENDSGAIEP